MLKASRVGQLDLCALETELCHYYTTVLLQYGALARAPALFSLSLEPQRSSQKCRLGGGGLGRGWGLELRDFPALERKLSAWLPKAHTARFQ